MQVHAGLEEAATVAMLCTRARRLCTSCAAACQGRWAERCWAKEARPTPHGWVVLQVFGVVRTAAAAAAACTHIGCHTRCKRILRPSAPSNLRNSPGCMPSLPAGLLLVAWRPAATAQTRWAAGGWPVLQEREQGG